MPPTDRRFYAHVSVRNEAGELVYVGNHETTDGAIDVPELRGEKGEQGQMGHPLPGVYPDVAAPANVSPTMAKLLGKRS